MPFCGYYGILELNGLIMSLLGKLRQGEYERGGGEEDEELKKKEAKEEEVETD